MTSPSPPRPASAEERAARARALMWMYLAAGLLGPVSVAVPHYPGTSVAGVLLVSAGALAAAALCRSAGARLGTPAIHCLVAGGSLLTSLGIHFSMGVPNAATMFYLWMSLYGFYFFTRRQALAQIAVVAVLYTAVIVLRPPEVPMVANWLVTIGTLLGAGMLVSVLKGRLDGVIGQLGRAARRDALTDLLNRRGFGEVVDHELERTHRSGSPFAVIICDLDRFKLVNDRFGHAAGDQVLCRFADILREHKRQIDTAARLGGEEFGLLLPDTSLEDAAVAAERLRLAVSAQLDSGGVPLTASFGVACFPEHGPTHEAILHCADQALYAAKKIGRDTVVAYEPYETERVLEEDAASDDGRLGAILLLAESLDLRDPSTAAHSRTVARYAELTALQLGLDAARSERVRLAGMLHDVGKISIPDSILHKPASLTEEEFDRMRRHPEIGARLIEGAGLDDLSGWVHAHHERPDGGGYPLGIDLNEIPIEARILSVADAYEAMIADRPYRNGMPPAAARGELRRHSGRQFDPAVVDAFLSVIDELASQSVAA